MERTADEIDWLKENTDYEYMPADIQTFVESEEFGEPKEIRPEIKRILIEVFTNIGQYKEIIIDAGVGTGKSYWVSKAWEFLMHRLLCLKTPAQYFGLAKDTFIYFINMATRGSQAEDIVFAEAKNRFDNAPWFLEHGFFYDKKITSELRFPKHLSIIPGNSEETFPLGYNIFCGVLDEAAWHKVTKEKDYAEEGYNNMRKRVRSRFMKEGLVIAISSPRYVDDYIEVKLEESKGSKNIYGIRIPTWDALPKSSFTGTKFDAGKYLPQYKGLMVPIEFEDDFKKNPEKTMRDYGAQPSKAIERYIKDLEALNNMFNSELPNGIDDETKKLTCRFDYHAAYFCHVDLAKNKDRAGFSMCHRQGKIRIDIATVFEAEPGSEIKFSVFREYIIQLKRNGFPIKKVTYDGWQSVDSIQLLKDKGITADTLSLDRDLEPYDTFKEVIYTKDIECPENPYIKGKSLAYSEAERLELIKGNKVDHPRLGSKDLIDAICGAVYNLKEYEGESAGTGAIKKDSIKKIKENLRKAPDRPTARMDW